MEDVASVVAGLVLVALAATGATVTQRRMEQEGRGRLVPALLIPFGVLLGAGAAIARGWDLWASVLVGAILVPLVAVVGRLIEVRRRRTGRP